MGEKVEKEKIKSTSKEKMSAKAAGDMLGFDNYKLFVVKLKFKSAELKTYDEWVKIFKTERLIEK